ncbi:MAG: COX15/CtaA family protein, partial [Pseudomonadota bacterium]
PGKPTKSKYAYFSFSLLFLQIISGSLVAGLKAGLVYNSFPLMDEHIIPQGLMQLHPWYLNFFENIINVQFMHRLLGVINLINILAYSYKIFKLDEKSKISIILGGFVSIQFALGIFTLILQVPLLLGLMHQAMAILVLTIMVISLKIKGK